MPQQSDAMWTEHQCHHDMTAGRDAKTCLALNTEYLQAVLWKSSDRRCLMRHFLVCMGGKVTAPAMSFDMSIDMLKPSYACDTAALGRVYHRWVNRDDNFAASMSAYWSKLMTCCIMCTAGVPSLCTAHSTALQCVTKYTTMMLL